MTIPKKLESAVEKVKQVLLNERVRNKSDLTIKTGLNYCIIGEALYNLGAELLPIKWHTETSILGLYKKGKSITEIATELRLTESTVRMYIKNPCIFKTYFPRTIAIEQTKLRIEGLAQQGKTISDIVKETGLCYETINIYGKKFGIAIPRAKRGIKPKDFPERDKLIEQGKNICEIGKAEGVTREAVRSYIKKKGLYKDWIAKRTNPKKEENSRKNTLCSIIHSIFEKRVSELSENEQWAVRKALEYEEMPYTHLSFEKTFRLFKEYREAQVKGEKISYSQLGERCGLRYNTIEQVLVSSRLGSLSGRKPLEKTPKWKMKAIRRAVNLKLSCADIGYFLQLPKEIIHQNFHYWDIADKRPKGDFVIKRFYRKGNRGAVGGSLSYRLASQIYESKDAGFSRQETVELLDTSNKAVEYALNYKQEISNKIIRALKVLYPKARTEKPYVNFGLDEYAKSFEKR